MTIQNPKTVKVALAQMVSHIVSAKGDEQENWETVEALVAEAAKLQVELLVLPENFLIFGGKLDFGMAAQEEWVANCARLAKRYNLWLVAGTLPLQLDNPIGHSLSINRDVKPFACCLVFDNRGQRQGEYRKVHLFDAVVADGVSRYRESDQFQHGSVPVVVNTPWGGLGLSVCYDLRFPEYFLLLREMGADLIAMPSAFTYVTGQAHWQVLARARAIENQCFVLACNQGGQHSPIRRTWGESMIIDPWGTVLDSREQGVGLVVASLDLPRLDDVREQIPVKLVLTGPKKTTPFAL